MRRCTFSPVLYPTVAAVVAITAIVSVTPRMGAAADSTTAASAADGSLPAGTPVTVPTPSTTSSALPVVSTSPPATTPFVTYPSSPPTTPTCVPSTSPPLDTGFVMTPLPVPNGYSIQQVIAINDQDVTIGTAITASGQPHAVRWKGAAFADLGTLPGGDTSGALGIGADDTVVGYSSAVSSIRQAVRWDRGGAITDLEAGGFMSEAAAIGGDGTIAGFITSGDGSIEAARWDRSGRITKLPDLGGTGSRATAINDTGTAIGYATTSDQVLHPALWDRAGRVVDLMRHSDAADGFVQVSGIDNAGTVIGFAQGSGRAMTWDPAHGLRALPSLEGGTGGNPTSINDHGTIVGTAMTATAQRAARWDGRRVTDLGTLLGATGSSTASSISDAGTVVGQSGSGAGYAHAVEWDSQGQIADLGGVNSCDTSNALAINNAGTVLGEVVTHGTATHTFVLWRRA